MKVALMRTATGKVDPELPLLQRISSLELPASEIAAQINASQSSSNRHISTSTVQRRLRESGLHGRIAAKKPLLKDTNKKKRLAWAKKHEQWTLDWWKSMASRVAQWLRALYCSASCAIRVPGFAPRLCRNRPRPGGPWGDAQLA